MDRCRLILGGALLLVSAVGSAQAQPMYGQPPPPAGYVAPAPQPVYTQPAAVVPTPPSAPPTRAPAYNPAGAPHVQPQPAPPPGYGQPAPRPGAGL